MSPPAPASRAWPAAVVFDLDGTLVDSVGDIAAALNFGLLEAGLTALAEDDVRRMVGRGIDITIQRALAHLGAECHDAGVIHRAFTRHYAAAPARHTTLYPGARDLVARLRSEGRATAICTNKPEDLTEAIVDALDLRPAFDAVIGASDRLPRKPDPAMLAAALAEVGVPPAGGVMVGDSSADVGTARALGVPIVLVSFGYTPVPARDLGGDAVIDHLADLPGALLRLATET